MSKKKKPLGSRDLKSRPANLSSPKNDRLFSFIIFSFAFLLYANTLNHGYVLDDDVVYLKNKDVQAGFSGINSILHHSFVYGFTGRNEQGYRPVVLIIYAVEKEFFGNNPRAGHFINVLLFALSCVLLFQLMKKLKPLPAFPTCREKRWFLFSSLREGWGGILPFITALLFAAHPIHTEVVANIKGRDDILNFIFFLLSLLFILKFIDLKEKKHLWLSAVFFFFSLLCKEMAVTFLAIIPLTLFFFREIPVKKIAVALIPFVAALGAYMLILSSVLETVSFAEKMKVVNNALAAATNESDRIATAVLILGKYMLLLFFPHPLSWDYSYNQIPIVSFSDIKVIITLVVFGAFGMYSAIILVKLFKKPGASPQGLLRRSQEPESAVYAYCILFFFITMSVVSNIFIMIGATLGERFLFIPSLAFCMAVAYILMSPHPTKHSPPAPQRGGGIPRLVPPFGVLGGLCFLFLLIVLFSFKTFTRNKDWKDNFSLFASGVEATPNSSRAESALGSAYREQAEKEPNPDKRVLLFQKAIPYYKKAIEILPDNTEALYNAGVAYYGMGDKENALKMYEQTLKISPEYTNASNNAGVIYFERKEYESAKKYFLQAIQYDANNADALGNLGAINHNLGNLPAAIEYYKKSLVINPSNQNVQANLANAERALHSKW